MAREAKSRQKFAIRPFLRIYSLLSAVDERKNKKKEIKTLKLFIDTTKALFTFAVRDSFAE